MSFFPFEGQNYTFDTFMTNLLNKKLYKRGSNLTSVALQPRDNDRHLVRDPQV